MCDAGNAVALELGEEEGSGGTSRRVSQSSDLKNAKVINEHPLFKTLVLSILIAISVTVVNFTLDSTNKPVYITFLSSFFFLLSSLFQLSTASIQTMM